jgi:hypothetical protein
VSLVDASGGCDGRFRGADVTSDLSSQRTRASWNALKREERAAVRRALAIFVGVFLLLGVAIAIARRCGDNLPNLSMSR